jgi:hypothetical protein
MSNHLKVDASASKLTTHTPNDADRFYLDQLHDELARAFTTLGFHNVKIDIRVESDA